MSVETYSVKDAIILGREILIDQYRHRKSRGETLSPEQAQEYHMLLGLKTPSAAVIEKAKSTGDRALLAPTCDVRQ